MQIVAGDQHGAPFGCYLSQQGHHGGFAALIHSGEGFIQQHDLGPLGDATGHESALLLPAGELPNLPVSQITQVHLFQGRIHRGVIIGSGASGQTHVPVSAHHHHLAHADRKRPIHRFALGDIGHRAVFTRNLRGIAADQHPPRGRPDQPHDRFEQRGLTRAIHTHQTGHPPGPQDQVHPAQRGHLPIVHAHVVHLECRLCCPAGRVT